jgi:hypothetical protein
MANFNTDTYTGQNGSPGASANASSLFPLSRDAGGKLRYLVIPYTVDGDEATGDTITLGILPTGAKVVPALCRVVSDTGFDVDDMDVGITGNVNKYADALDTLNTASDISFGVAGDNAYVPTATSAAETVIATLVNVVTTTAGGKALFLIGYFAE